MLGLAIIHHSELSTHNFFFTLLVASAVRGSSGQGCLG